MRNNTLYFIFLVNNFFNKQQARAKKFHDITQDDDPDNIYENYWNGEWLSIFV